MNVKITILVVEDFEEIRFVTRELLESNGYQVIGASNGKEALDYLKSGSIPDLIVLDLSMPVMTGHEFRKVQLKDKTIKNVPVILYSAEPSLRETADDLKCNGFAYKDQWELLREVERVLAVKRKA